MAICPECFSREKSFFAGRCEECNQPVGFLRQLIVQVAWYTVYVAVVVGSFSLLLMAISG
jgi:hypothetical protein